MPVGFILNMSNVSKKDIWLLDWHLWFTRFYTFSFLGLSHELVLGIPWSLKENRRLRSSIRFVLNSRREKPFAAWTLSVIHWKCSCDCNCSRLRWNSSPLECCSLCPCYLHEIRIVIVYFIFKMLVWVNYHEINLAAKLSFIQNAFIHFHFVSRRHRVFLLINDVMQIYVSVVHHAQVRSQLSPIESVIRCWISSVLNVVKHVLGTCIIRDMGKR